MLTESITAAEAAILDALRRRRIATPPDLAVMGRLTPNEVHEAVQHLEEQQLVEHFDSSFLRLTPAGDEVANANASRSVSTSTARYVELDQSEVESRLNAIIEQL